MTTTPTAADGPTGAGADDAPAPAGPRGPGRAASVAVYVLGRLLTAIVSLFAVIVAGFFLFRILPGDPVRAMTEGREVTAEQREELRRQFGLDQPLWLQFLDYAKGLLHFDLGVSFQYREPVADLILERLGPTLLLAGTGTIIAALLGLFLGTRAGWRPGGRGDRINTAVALFFWSVPTFWLGLLLIVLLASGRGFMPGLFPTGGMVDPTLTGPVERALSTAQHMVLPIVTMVAVIYAQYLMIMRSSLMDEKGADYLTTARAKGLRDALVRRRHAVPNALLPTVTLIFLNLGQVVSGVILVETVFSWPGLGQLFYSGLQVPDIGLVQGLFVVFAASVILMNLLADLVYPLLDPRVRP
ncbi:MULTISPECIES: ABC transporter permease [Nocardiopsis]|uniref:ABC transporter permease n=2 Tax=Nocardiopsis alba TaxID=53437 RepID=A0A7K2IW72_9ACTN|nr:MULTISPECIES: ABC transporter permease [Nocardiopsis]AFR11017.1 binding--dependent transport system inner membrane component family protein [Nocardiopsis alba ATCC BAA-2165]MEC3892428.1 ABC transporter permease [Nocardiopsis sp. LDBS1602]MYR34218.1 ABC transporter permease subunit [Nocardiopsis alba]